MNNQNLYILMISVHGLLRGQDMELGRDSDTGGQITYVVELAKALGRNPDVGQIDLLTRLIEDPQVSDDYAQPEEPLERNVRIVRLPFGPQRYLRKELLWPHLDQMVDRCLHLIRQQGRLPDIIHTHYADAGYVGMQLSNLLGVPQVHTGHSLGRPKRQRLLDSGRKEQTIEKQLNLSRRISVEEQVLEHASLIITSTRQEISDQYGMYNARNKCQFSVIPPGTDTSRFFPPGRKPIDPEIVGMVNHFLDDPGKPFILAICRPDARKNLHGLIQAYGESPKLQALANLVIVAGTREDIRQMDDSQRKVMTDLLLDIDRYDLWGKVAVPKNCVPEQIPELYRLAVKRRGVFVNPALTEPFGLTLIEAAASGLPFVATEDGGPVDIVANCHSGLLVNPFYPEEIAQALLTVLGDRRQWFRWSRNGILGVKRHYSWDAHVSKYLKAVNGILHRDRKRMRRMLAHSMRKTPMPFVKKALISDIDNTLIGDEKGLQKLVSAIKDSSEAMAFGVATGRTLESTVRVLKKWHVPMPDVLITSVGSEIHYWPTLKQDTAWRHHISHNWRRDDLAEVLSSVPGLRLQPEENQREFKLSYYVVPDRMPPLRQLYRLLRERRLQANLVYSHQAYLDVLPERASKGRAIRYLSYKWGVPLQNFLVAGDSGNDEEMLVGDTLGIVVGNHSPELEPLRGQEQIYFADHMCANGILEGLEHYGFLQDDETSEEVYP
ncbi:MAG TPA: HAD-IIB family hydrolase [Methylophilaceae bacterium]|nr:HAD-IIB family hydrolase [Methylophilaceae bacterium]